MPTVHLVRHGHVFNPDKILYGRIAGFHLSDAGHQMAEAVADYMVTSKVPVTRIVASPLQRAQETAAPIAAAFGLEISTDERITEAGNVFEGRPLQSGPKDFIHPRNWWLLRNPRTPSWGEPYKELAARMWAALDDAATKNPDADTVLVSHQLPIWVARTAFAKRSYVHDPRKRECALASITSFRYEDGKAVQMTYASPAAHIAVP